MTIQLGGLAQTGSVVVSNSNGTSNGLPFTVRSGSIYFVATGGKDSNSGSYSSPWQTLVHAVQTAGAGSIIYAMNGVSQGSDDGQGWDAAITLRSGWSQGSSASPKALVAYPGATVTVGNAAGASPPYGIRGTDSTAGDGACGGNWVLAGLNLRGLAPSKLLAPARIGVLSATISPIRRLAVVVAAERHWNCRSLLMQRSWATMGTI